jgi:hypothetical protein
MMRLLREMGLPAKPLQKLARFTQLPVRNCRGEEVGSVEATEFAL